MSNLNYIFFIIIAAVNGALLGNYLTTAYHRIPINKPLNGMSNIKGLKPHCSNCNHELKYYEYYPILSWFSTKFRCNYCKIKTDKTYTILEITILGISIISYIYIGLGTTYIIFLLYLAALFLNIIFLIKFNKFYLKSFLMMVISAILLILSHEI